MELTGEWLLSVAWAVFRFAAGAPCSDAAEGAFEALYGAKAEAASKVLGERPFEFGEVLAWCSTMGQQAGLLAARRQIVEVTDNDVRAAAQAVRGLSGTTWC